MRPVTRRAALAGVATLATVGLPAVAGPAAPAGHTLPAHVRAEIVRLVRDLTPAQHEAWLRAGRRMVAGMPAFDAAVLLYRDLGSDHATARRTAADVLALAPGGAP